VSKRAEAVKTLREMNDAELAEHLRGQRRKLFEIRFQQATGQVENHRQVREVRREIARTMTVQIEAERQLAVPPARDAGKVAPVARVEPAEAAGDAEASDQVDEDE
jgi:large subunit ribosomal protein L29